MVYYKEERRADQVIGPYRILCRLDKWSIWGYNAEVKGYEEKSMRQEPVRESRQVRGDTDVLLQNMVSELSCR